MELSSSKVQRTWKPFVLGCIAGSLIILLLHSQSHDYASFSIAKATTQHNEYVTESPLRRIESPQMRASNPIAKVDTPPMQSSSPIPNFKTPQVQTSSSPIEKVEIPSVQTSSPMENSETSQVQTSTTQVQTSSSSIEKVETPEVKKTCNIFEGKWVYKPNKEVGAAYPDNYSVKECPFLNEAANCRKNGRQDLEFENWSWEPTDCVIPLMNPRDMLERLRGKRMIIVGDSLAFSQWASLACLMYISIPPSSATSGKCPGGCNFLKVKDYNFTLEFYWSAFLAELSEKTQNGKRVLKLDKPSADSDRWQGADVMVFNSGHWWNSERWDVLEYNGKVIKEMSKYEAYNIAMTTWTKWVSNNVDQTKTRVFFRGISPAHFSQYWCYNVTQPIMDESYTSTTFNPFIEAGERVIEETNKKTQLITYLNITKLSGYRRDAHNSFYQSTKWKDANGNFTVMRSLADCSHWCLPGLPDTWNRLLYVSLFYNP